MLSKSDVLILRMISGTVQVKPTSRWFFDAMITSSRFGQPGFAATAKCGTDMTIPAARENIVLYI